jgi:hypothetical protein
MVRTKTRPQLSWATVPTGCCIVVYPAVCNFRFSACCGHGQLRGAIAASKSLYWSAVSLPTARALAPLVAWRHQWNQGSGERPNVFGGRGLQRFALLGSAVATACLSTVVAEATASTGERTPGMDVGIPEDARVLQRLYEDVAPVSSGWCTRADDTGVHIVVRNNNADMRLKSARSFLRTVRWDTTDGDWKSGSSFPVELRDCSLLTPSPSGKSMALVRGTTVGTTRQYFIEVRDPRLRSVHLALVILGLHYAFGWCRSTLSMGWRCLYPSMTSMATSSRTQRLRTWLTVRRKVVLPALIGRG